MTDTQVDLSAVMEKVALLKNLQERAGTPGEAAAAAAAIQKLMYRFNLSEFQVNAAERQQDVGYEKMEFDIGTPAIWKQDLLQVVSKYNFCRPLIGNYGGRNGRKRVQYAVIVGKPYNATIAKNLYDFLEVEIDRLANIAWRERVTEVESAVYAGEYDWINPPSLNAKRFKTSFREAAIAAIRDRLEQQFKESQEYEGGSSMVLVVEDELDDAVEQMFGKVRRGHRSSKDYDSVGWSRGEKAGREVNLVNQVEG